MDGMRALRFTGPAPDRSTTAVVDVPVPWPGPGEVSIDVAYAGVNFVDVMIRRGDPVHGARFPVVPGTEAAGTVRAVGPDVTGLAPGDRVTAYTGLGALAEVVVAPAAVTRAVPASLDLAPAAVAPAALATAVLLVDSVVGVRPGGTVLVHSAAGGVGQAVAQLALARGAARVIGTVGGPGRVAAARDAGYDPVLVRDDDLAVRVRALTDGRGVDVVLDPQGSALIGTDLALASPGARIVVFGNAGGGPMSPLPSPGELMGRNASVAGFSLSALVAAAPERVGAAIATALELLVDGTFRVALTEVDGLDGAAAAQQALADGDGRGKRVVRVGRPAPRAVRPAGRPAAPR